MATLALPHLSVAQQITAQGSIATTTVTTSICGNSLVDPGEQCDVPGETGVYSTSIAGRQCKLTCEFGPYCGDGILQTLYGEECDDGNNDSGDFCSSACTIEPAGSGGGGSSGGGRASNGGSNIDLGATQINVAGKTFPRAEVHIILDTDSVGTVRADADGRFEFATESSPGTVSMGFWTTDDANVRSITYNTTFDVTQGAITNINSLIIPPTLKVSDATINPGDTVTFTGQTVPRATVEVLVGQDVQPLRTTTDASGKWSITYTTAGLPASDYTVKARAVTGTGGLTTESGFSTAVQLFVGVDGQASTPSDLNRDGSVNLTDFSIMIFWWGTDAGNSDPSADINGNGKVGIEDFSILLFNWTG